MSLKEACDFVPDDLPDGAFWAMAHDIAGADYGDTWGELKEKKHRCPVCHKAFGKEESMQQHQAAAHHPKERVKCTFQKCNRQFRKETHMLQHYEMVHGEKP